VTNTPGAAPVPATPPPASTSSGSSLGARLAGATGTASPSAPTAANPVGYPGDSAEAGSYAPPSARGSQETASFGTAPAAGATAASSTATAAGAAGGPRTARLTIASVDPWSVLKLSFLLSVALGIALVISSMVLWSVLNGMGVFEQINSVLSDVSGTGEEFDIFNYVGFGRVVSLSTVVGVVNVVLITALSTIGAFLYNLSAGLVGGLHVTLSDD
jgi:hypothetical protein